MQQRREDPVRTDLLEQKKKEYEQRQIEEDKKETERIEEAKRKGQGE